MARTEGRTAAETREHVLQATTFLFMEHGLATTLAQVAASAGLSKSGLKYHFPSKLELVDSLARYIVDSFRTEVRSCLVEDDCSPGRLARAYILANADPDMETSIARDRSALTAILGTLPSAQRILVRDAERWEHALTEDGLDRTLRDVVVAAADGASSSHLWGGVQSTERIATLRDHLIGLTLTQTTETPTRTV